MINLHESMGPDRDRTRDPWICSQTRICSKTRYRLRYAARLCLAVNNVWLHVNALQIKYIFRKNTLLMHLTRQLKFCSCMIKHGCVRNVTCSECYLLFLQRTECIRVIRDLESIDYTSDISICVSSINVLLNNCKQILRHCYYWLTGQ